ncbi:MAG: DUF4282 domain-containing protein [Pseudomonadota bacterium]
MTELVGRFLSFEETMGRGLVTFGYYLLLFLLIVTTLYDLIVAFAGFFGAGFLGNMGKFFVLIPVQFIVMLIGLRVATEFVLAVLGINDSLKSEPIDGDVFSSGLNPVRHPSSRMASAVAAEPVPAEDDEDEAPAPTAKTTKKRAKKAAKKTTKKRAATKKAADPAPAPAPEPANDPAPSSDEPKPESDA